MFARTTSNCDLSLVRWDTCLHLRVTRDRVGCLNPQRVSAPSDHELPIKLADDAAKRFMQQRCGMQSAFRSGTYLTVLFLVPMLSSCSKSSPTAPTPAARPTISVASLTVSGETRSSGYAYRVVLHLRETAGVMSTISSVQLTFVNGGKNVASSRFDQPLATGSTIPPNGTADTKELVTVDDSGNPYAIVVQAVVTFTDGASYSGTASGSADVLPLPQPPPPQTYTLAGVITDVTTHAAIEGARLDVLTGLQTRSQVRLMYTPLATLWPRTGQRRSISARESSSVTRLQHPARVV